MLSLSRTYLIVSDVFFDYRVFGKDLCIKWRKNTKIPFLVTKRGQKQNLKIKKYFSTPSCILKHFVFLKKTSYFSIFLNFSVLVRILYTFFHYGLFFFLFFLEFITKKIRWLYKEKDANCVLVDLMIWNMILDKTFS